MAVKLESQADKKKDKIVYTCCDIQFDRSPMSRNLIQSLLERGNVETNPGPEDSG